jgi:hypothetical protein
MWSDRVHPKDVLLRLELDAMVRIPSRLGVVVGRRRQPLGLGTARARPAGTGSSDGGHPISRRVFFSFRSPLAFLNLTTVSLPSPRRWLQLRETKTSDAASVSE